MARASTVTLIPLDRFAAILGIDPLHFNSVTSALRPDRNACDDLWFQYSWQDTGRISREDIAYGLYEAEQRVIDELGYFPVPHWVTSEELRLPDPYPSELRYTTNRNVRFMPKSLTTRYGYVVDFGVRTKTLIDESAAVAYSDSTGDGYDDLATISVTTTETNVQNIHVYFAGESADDSWEIRPVNVSISGGVATITFPKYMAVKPSLWESLGGDSDGKFAINGDSNANFIATADVYQVTLDPSEQATFVYNTPCSACGTVSCTTCEESTESGCLQIRDAKLGMVTYKRANWDATTESFSSASFSQTFQPDRIQISYRAGLQDPQSSYPLYRMRRDWERVIIFYALTLMDHEISGCNNVGRIINRQLEDLAMTVDRTSFLISEANLNNPLGTTRAAINIWRKIKKERLASAG